MPKGRFGGAAVLLIGLASPSFWGLGDAFTAAAQTVTARRETAASFDSAEFLAEHTREAQRETLLDHVKAMMEPQHYADRAAFERRADEMAARALQVIWAEQDRMAREEADFQQRYRASRFPETLGRWREEHERKMRRAYGTLRSNVHNALRYVEYQIGQDRASFERTRAWEEFKRDNPEEYARRERLAAAQAQREAAHQARLQGWQVVHIRENVCQPIADVFPGATNPDQVLAAIRATDPDAGYEPGADWRGKGLATIETSRGLVNLAANYYAFNNIIRMLRPR